MSGSSAEEWAIWGRGFGYRWRAESGGFTGVKAVFFVYALGFLFIFASEVG